MHEVRSIGSRLELFVDDYLIDSLKGVSLQLQRPQHAGIAVAFDERWEGLFSGCITTIKDGDRYLMYYRGMPGKGDGSGVESTCLAISLDGIHWDKPRLGLVEYDGSRENNIILRHRPASHNFTPFLDQCPGVPESERFKAFAGIHPDGLLAFASPDGIHWRLMQDAPVVTSEPFAFDSMNVAFWSEPEGCYVLYYRTWRQRTTPDGTINYRWVSRVTSDDFLHWSSPEEMDDGDAPTEQIYTQQTHPYCRAPHIYLALAARFWEGRQVVSDGQAASIGVHPDYCHDCSDAVLMTSRGGSRYDRTFLKSFLRPGPGLNNWVSRTNYPGLGIVPTAPEEMSFYVHRHYASPSAHAARYTLRTDGFTAVNASYHGGSMTTLPLTFSGSRLVLNYSTSTAGGVRVEVQDKSGKPILGYTFDESDPMIGDEIEGVATWGSQADVGKFSGQPVRLCFEMKDADLYSIRFRD